jgi:NAD dependent epimerase/dehydratase family enzyme
MANILIVGCGDLGTAIATNLKHEHQVTGLRRSIHAASGGMQIICADVTQPNTLSVLSNLNPNIVIYCISADAQTDESYQAHYVTGLKNVLATQTNNDALQHAFFVSSTRPFGQKTDAILDENTPAIPNDFGGVRLLEAEEALIDFCDNKGMPCKSTSMRLSGIYGNGRLYLANMAKDIAKWPSENNWSHRIHRDDAAAFIAFLVNKTLQNQPVKDCYIVTDDMPTQQYEVLKWLAMQQGVDATQVKTPTVSGGKRLSNKRLRETGFQLQYPNYQVGYRQILKE